MVEVGKMTNDRTNIRTEVRVRETLNLTSNALISQADTRYHAINWQFTCSTNTSSFTHQANMGKYCILTVANTTSSYQWCHSRDVDVAAVANDDEISRPPEQAVVPRHHHQQQTQLLYPLTEFPTLMTTVFPASQIVADDNTTQCQYCLQLTAKHNK